MYRLPMMSLRGPSRPLGMACLVVVTLLPSACGAGSTGSSGSNSGGGSITAGNDVAQFTVSGAVSESRTLTVAPANVTHMTFVGSYDTSGNKVFNFFIQPSGNASGDSLSLDISNFTGPGSYPLQGSNPDKTENIDIGLTVNGGVDWSLQNSPGKTCQAAVSAASAFTSGGVAMEKVQGTFSCAELDALALFGVQPIHVTDGSFTVFVPSV